MDHESVDERCLLVPDTEDQHRFPIIDGQYVVPDSEEEENVSVDSGVTDKVGETADKVGETVDAVGETVQPAVGEVKIEAPGEGVHDKGPKIWSADYDHPDNQLVFELMCDYYPGYRSLWHETKGE